MDILQLKVLRGPNYWSNNRKKLIEMKLDLKQYEELPTNRLNGFPERLKKLLPSMYSHRCSEGHEGGFFFRLDDGTWLGHVIEHVALELQMLAGMTCGFGRTYGTSEYGVYHVIFAYESEKAGLQAAKIAVNLVETLAANNRDYTSLQQDVETLKNIGDTERLGPSTDAIVKEAEKRQIPVHRIQNTSLVILGHGKNQRKIWASLADKTSSIAVELVADKDLTKELLQANHIPVPNGCIVSSELELDNAIKKLGYPLVTKPKNGNHGRGVTTNINNKEKALLGFVLAQRISNEIIIEHFIPGQDYRFLLVNHRVVAVAKRTPAYIMGTGTHTIQELIDLVNRDPKRGEGHENLLTKITIDECTLAILAEKNLSLNSILPSREILLLKDTANLSAGGTAIDVTEEVHPSNISLAERVSRLMDLDICGIDIVAQDIAKPLPNQGAIIEVNAGPGLRMHLAPTHGQARPVAEPILDMLYPKNSSATIPLIAVTGTNGKTTVVRLMAYLAQKAGHQVGFTTTEGIYINNECIYCGDCSGPLSAKTILHDPLIDFAVLECARGGILRSGLGFTHCDISIITNISNDHLGLSDINSVEELADVKAVVARSTRKNGYTILNADDDLVYNIKTQVECHVALFAMHKNERITQHCFEGGLVAYVEGDSIVIEEGEAKHYLLNVKSLPCTFEGTASFMIQNILAACLSAKISKIALSEISSALQSFESTADTNPGRMNLFDFDSYQVMIDYAHNEGAFIDLKRYINQLPVKNKVGIIAATGDRRDEDIKALGFHAAEMFDEIIIRHNQDGRGRTDQELTDLMLSGIADSNFNPNVKVISDEVEAIDYAITTVSPDSFIFWAVDDVKTAVDYMKRAEKEFNFDNKVRISHDDAQREIIDNWRS